MELDWSQGELAEGLRCYRNGEFFAAHEHWELVWLGLQEPEKTFLQAVIQVAAAFHHFRRGNLLGTSSLLNAAVRKLQRYPEEFGGVAVGQLRRGVRIWQDALEQNRDMTGLVFPTVAIR